MTILKIKLELFTLIKRLVVELESELGEREEYLDKLSELKSRLVELSRPVILFDIALKLTGMNISNEYKLNHLSRLNIPNNNIDINQIVDDCMNYISAAPTSSDADFRRSGIMASIPHLMPKAKFEEYLDKSLNILFTDVSESFIRKSTDILLCELMPFKYADISALFPLVYKKIKEIHSIDIKNKENSELEELLSDVDETIAVYDAICSDLNMLYNDINFLYANGKYATDIEQILDDFELKDLYYSACELLESDNSLALVETVRERNKALLENILVVLKKQRKEYSAVTKPIINKNFDELEESITAFLTLTADVARLYYAELLSEVNITEFDLRITEATDNSELITQSITKIKDACTFLSEHYPPAEQKYVKQIITEDIPYPFDNNELRKYIFNTLYTIKDSNSLLLAVDNIRHLFSENYYDTDNTCGCGHEHYHHDHDCGCGHNHH